MFPDKATLIAMLITALVFGTLLLINLDRGISSYAGVDTAQESVHGWPLVYLVRMPNEFAISSETRNFEPWPWPWPAIDSETRIVSWMNATTDFIVCTAIVVITYIISHTVAKRLAGNGDKSRV